MTIVDRRSGNYWLTGSLDGFGNPATGMLGTWQLTSRALFEQWAEQGGEASGHILADLEAFAELERMPNDHDALAPFLQPAHHEPGVVWLASIFAPTPDDVADLIASAQRGVLVSCLAPTTSRMPRSSPSLAQLPRPSANDSRPPPGQRSTSMR